MDDNKSEGMKFEDNEARDLAEEESKPAKRAPDSEQGTDVPEGANSGDADGPTPSDLPSGGGGASQGGGTGNP